jgi:uncharacterized membrane protein
VHTLYVVTVVLHILSAMLWVGGMGFFALVVVPSARAELAPPEAVRLLRRAGARFTKVGWAALGVLGVTGILNLWYRGVLPLLASGAFWQTPFGMVLAAKLVVVAAVLAVSILHARDASARAHTAPSVQRRVSLLGRGILGLSLVVVALAVVLVRGVP